MLTFEEPRTKIMYHTLITLFIAHWIGDYVLQSSAMASRKRSEIKWLGLHVFTYTISIGVASFALFPVELALLFASVNGILHFIVDFFTSKISYRYKENPRVFFPILGFDQLLHTLSIIVTLHFMSIGVDGN